MSETQPAVDQHCTIRVFDIPSKLVDVSFYCRETAEVALPVNLSVIQKRIISYGRCRLRALGVTVIPFDRLGAVAVDSELAVSGTHGIRLIGDNK